MSLTSCDWNLYTSTGLITPEITLTTPATTKTEASGFNLLSIAPEGIPSSYSVSVPTAAGYTILKGQSADSTERFIEALSYLKQSGRLKEMLEREPGEATAKAVKDTLTFTADTLSLISGSIDSFDKSLQQVLQILTEIGISIPEIHFFSDLTDMINTMAARLTREKVTVADYITLQYYIDILSSVLRLSVPIINIVSETGSSLTLEDVEKLVSGEGITSELEARITEALKNNSATLIGILIDALSAVDQTGRLVNEYIPSLPDLTGILSALTGGSL